MGPGHLKAADAQFLLHVPLPFLSQDKSYIFALDYRVVFGNVGHPPVFTRRPALKERVAIFCVVLQISSVGRFETQCLVFGTAGPAGSDGAAGSAGASVGS